MTANGVFFFVNRINNPFVNHNHPLKERDKPERILLEQLKANTDNSRLLQIIVAPIVNKRFNTTGFLVVI